jgi:hypothetical protein
MERIPTIAYTVQNHVPASAITTQQELGRKMKSAQAKKKEKERKHRFFNELRRNGG